MLFRWSDVRTASFARRMLFAQGEVFLANLCQMTAFAIKEKNKNYNTLTKYGEE